MILVVSYPDEEHTDAVIKVLGELGREVDLLDLSEFPVSRSVSLGWETGTRPSLVIEGPRGALDLSQVRVGWWRRVRSFTLDETLRGTNERSFAHSETSHAVLGMLDSLTCAWVNPPGPDEAAHHKPYQWSVAASLGLTLPRTLVTNKPDAARDFLKDGRPAVFKAFLAQLEAWRETRLVEPSDLERLDSVRFAPVIFQDYVEGVDLRITVVGRKIFAAEIDARQTPYPVDMRMVVGEAEVRPVTLPPEVEAGLLALMDRLRLVYGAIDMRRRPDGEHVFLEVNPAGQWMFVENRTGLPITRAVADHLAGLDEPLAG